MQPLASLHPIGSPRASPRVTKKSLDAVNIHTASPSKHVPSPAQSAPQRSAGAVATKAQAAGSYYNNGNDGMSRRGMGSSTGVEAPAMPQASSSPHAALVTRFFNHLTRRDLGALFQLLAPEVVYENAAMQVRLQGKQGVVKFYIDALTRLPQGAAFVLDEVSVSEAPEPASQGPYYQGGYGRPLINTHLRRVAVAWHLELGGLEIPLSRGLSMYKADTARGLLTDLRDVPKDEVRLLLPMLGLATPAIDTASPLLMPLLRETSSLLKDSGPLVSGLTGLASDLTSTVTQAASAVIGGAAAVASGAAATASEVVGTAGPLGFFAPFVQAVAQATGAATGGSNGTMGYGMGAADGTQYGSYGAGAQGSEGASYGAPAQQTPQAQYPYQQPQPQPQQYYGGAPGAASYPADPLQAQQQYNYQQQQYLAYQQQQQQQQLAMQYQQQQQAQAAQQWVEPPPAAGLGPGVLVAGAAPASTSQQQQQQQARKSAAYDIPMRRLPTPPADRPASASASPAAAASASGPQQGGRQVQGRPIRGSPQPTYAASATTSAPPTSRTTSPVTAAAAGAAGPVASAYSAGPASAPAAPGSPRSTAAPRIAAAVAAHQSSQALTRATAGGASSGSEADLGEPGDLSGLWEKDAEASQSDSYERMLQLLGLGGLQRMTARLIDGLDIKDTANGFEVGFVTVVPFFRVTEATKFNGQPVQLMRRDLRPGQQRAVAQRVGPGGVRVAFDWGDPNAGTLEEVYQLVSVGKPGGDEMTVTSTLSVGGQTVTTVQVYRRSGKDRSQLLQESRARNTSLQDVLAKQKQQYGDRA